MKKVLLSLFALLLVVTGCGSSTDSTEKDSKNIIMITDIGGIDDKSFNQGTWEGVQKLDEEKDDLGSEYLTSKKEADYDTNLTAATDKNPELVVAAGFLFANSMAAIAQENPDQNYLLIDEKVTDKDGKQLDNVVSALFAEQEGSYLTGVAAGLKAKEAGKNKVGFIGGMESDLIKKFEVGYVAGVKSVLPDAEIDIQYAGDFGNASLGKAIAAKMYDSGSYVIYHAAGGTGNGLISEAKERVAAGQDVWAIGVDKDQYEEGKIEGSDKSVILTSMVKRVDVASYEVSKLAYEGKFKGGEIMIFDMKNEGVGIPEKNPNLSDDILKAIEQAKEDIISGEVVVPSK